ncbi:MAG: IS200/IS605 family transposase [Bacteroidetes bacterium]|nr:IS200/IS605 family transposase [Bacteroidota bacterium]
MNTYTQILYHVVFATKFREFVLTNPDNRNRLYAYMGGLIHSRNSTPIIINGIEDHIHLLFDLHPSVCVSDIVKELKVGSSNFIRNTGLFPQFKYWQNGYAAFTVSNQSMHILVNYIKNQVTHHSKESSKKEIERLLNT